jgi:hypothetical protein
MLVVQDVDTVHRKPLNEAGFLSMPELWDVPDLIDGVIDFRVVLVYVLACKI